jgi:Cof subfamily protein (haloacid dehalogenase superfamily)
MSIKLVAIDLDGTLLNHRKEIPSEVAQAVREAGAKGIRVMIASGRLSVSVRHYAAQLELAGPHICCNGADIVMGNGEILHHVELPLSEARVCAEFALENGLQINIYTATEVLFFDRSEWTERYLQRVPHLNPRFIDMPDLDDVSVSKVLLMDHADRIPLHRAQLTGRLNHDLCQITESEPEYLEVLPVGVSKGAALKRVAESLGIQQQETAAIGDYMNDFEMVEWACFGGAMENATPALKSIANLIVSTNDNNGVAEFLAAIGEDRR